MGNQSLAQRQVTMPLGFEWQEVVLDQHISDNMNYILLRNIQTGQEAQQYLITVPSNTLPDELNRYNLRHLQNLHLVTVKNVEVLDGGGSCSGARNHLRVVTQKISHSLSAHPRLNEQQAKKIFLKALIGFKAIYEFEGYIPITPQLIFFNQSGDLKVWMNQDLPVNRPQGISGIRSNDFESKMVNEVISTISFQTLNPKQFQLLRGLLVVNGVVNFERSIAILSSLIPKERGTSPISLLTGSAVSPRTQSVIKAIESQGLKVISTREEKRYVEEPAKTLFKQIQPTQQSVFHLQNTMVQNSGPVQSTFETRTFSNSNIQEATFLQNSHPLRLQLNKIPQKIVTGTSHNTSATRLIRNSPQRIAPRKSNLISSSPNLILSKEASRRSPAQPRQTIYFQNNPSTSNRYLSPQSSIKTIFQQVVTSGSPYFKDQPYVVHQPIIRSYRNDPPQLSKISRVSVNSNHSNRSQNRILPSKIIYSKIEAAENSQPYPSPDSHEQQSVYSNQPSGFANDNVIESLSPSVAQPLRKQPSISKNLPPEAPLLQTPPQTLTNINQNTLSSSHHNRIEWIKITKKNEHLVSPKQPSTTNSSKIPTDVPNSPATPRDIMISREELNTLDGNKFSIADLIQHHPKNECGIQVDTMYWKSDLNKSSHVDSKESGVLKNKKMVIYTDVATIHCDDAIIEKRDETYRIIADVTPRSPGFEKKEDE